MNTNYPNHGKPWNDAERLQVIELHSAGNSIDQIAERLGRKPNSIERRLIDARCIEDVHGWTSKGPSTAQPVEASPVAKQVMLLFCPAFRDAFDDEYWAGKHALRGQGNPNIVREFESLAAFLQKQLPPDAWGDFMSFALLQDSQWKTAVRPSSLENDKHMGNYKAICNCAPVCAPYYIRGSEID